mgnify:CR=1 FL=1
MEENRIYYVGIDHGNHLMKTSNHVFENGVERQAVKPTFQANTLVYDGAFYKIGEKRNSVKDSKLADDDYYLLTLAALAKECQAGSIPNGARVVLGVGLPLKQFATVRKQFVKYLKRGNQPVHFKFEDVAYDFTIENVLAFPQCYAAVADRLGSMKGEYLIVDGYNIIFAWKDLNELSRVNIDSARDKLLDILSNYQGYKSCPVLVVFDAYKRKEHPGARSKYHNLDVVYTKTDETADAFIERTVHEIGHKYRVTVATNDGLEQLTVMSQGALRMSADNLREEIERLSRLEYENYLASQKR